MSTLKEEKREYLEEQSSELIDLVYSIQQRASAEWNYNTVDKNGNEIEFEDLFDDISLDFYEKLELINEILIKTPLVKNNLNSYVTADLEIARDLECNVGDKIFRYAPTNEDFLKPSIKLPAFMIAKNEVASKSRQDRFVLHTKKPQILFQVKEKKDMANIPKIGAQTTVNEIQYLIYPVQVYDLTFLGTANEIAGLVNRAADWWHNYLKYNQKQG